MKKIGKLCIYYYDIFIFIILLEEWYLFKIHWNVEPDFE